MPRYAKNCDISDLKKAIIKKINLDPDTEETFDENNTNLDYDRVLYEAANTFIYKMKENGDLKKIDFDFENINIDNIYNIKEANRFLGFQKIQNLTFCGIYAGGDWEAPVCFVLYLDPKNNVRAYIPVDGNLFNRKHKKAYGNAWENGYEDQEKEEIKKLYNVDIETEDLGIDSMDFTALLNDVLNRIKVKEK